MSRRIFESRPLACACPDCLRDIETLMHNLNGGRNDWLAHLTMRKKARKREGAVPMAASAAETATMSVLALSTILTHGAVFDPERAATVAYELAMEATMLGSFLEQSTREECAALAAEFFGEKRSSEVNFEPMAHSKARMISARQSVLKIAAVANEE